MTKRERIAELEQLINELEKRASKLFEETWAWRAEIKKLRGQIIEEEKMLQESSWKLISDESLLTYYDKLPALCKFLRPEYHESYDFWNEEDIDFYCDDNEAIMRFHKPENMFTFIKRLGLVVDTSEVDDKIKNLEERAERLKAIKAMSKGKK